MTRKLTLFLLIITIMCFSLSLTSCKAESDDLTNSLTSILPAEDSSEVAKIAHDMTDWIGQQFENFLKFDWAIKAWNWFDSTFGIVDKVQQTGEAIELIKTGEFNNILAGLTTIFGCGIILIIAAFFAFGAILVTILIEFIVQILLIIFSALLIVVVLLLAVVGFVFVILPKF